jgi:hypothetical protein
MSKMIAPANTQTVIAPTGLALRVVSIRFADLRSRLFTLVLGETASCSTIELDQEAKQTSSPPEMRP